MARDGSGFGIPLLLPILLFADCYQIWEYFLAYSTIIARQGSATCYQITMVKNINSTHRVEGIPSQFGLQGALAASKIDRAAHKAQNVAGGLSEKVKQALRPDTVDSE